MNKTCSICGNAYRNIHSHQKRCKSPKPRHNAAGQEQVSSSARDCSDLLDFDIVRRPRSSRDAAGQEQVSSSARDCSDLLDFDIVRRPRSSRDAAGQEQVSSSARDCSDLLDFDIVRRPRSSRDAMKEMDAADALVLLQERRGKDIASDDEAIVSSDVVQKDNQKLDVCSEFDAAIAVINLLSFKPERSSASVDLYGGTDKCANEALSLTDDGQGLVGCPENSAVMELKQPKLDLKVSDNSENPVSDDAQGGINDASGLGMPKGNQTSLTEPMAREADQEPESALEALKEQAAKGTTSVDEPGTDIPGDESGADNSEEVLTSCSEKSSCSVECYGGGESTRDLKEAASAPYGGMEKSGNEAPAVEEKELSRKYSHEAFADCPEKSAATELKKPKLDHKVLDDYVVMQEEKHKIGLVAPAPGDSSEEERSDIIDGQANQTP